MVMSSSISIRKYESPTSEEACEICIMVGPCIKVDPPFPSLQAIYVTNHVSRLSFSERWSEIRVMSIVLYKQHIN